MHMVSEVLGGSVVVSGDYSSAGVSNRNGSLLLRPSDDFQTVVCYVCERASEPGYGVRVYAASLLARWQALIVAGQRSVAGSLLLHGPYVNEKDEDSRDEICELLAYVESAPRPGEGEIRVMLVPADLRCSVRCISVDACDLAQSLKILAILAR